jgi:uncharacterized protein (TIGR00266 family)
MEYEIRGSTMQTLSVNLAPGETLYSQTHAMSWMSDNIAMQTHTGGGLLAGLSRSFGGGSFFITDYAAQSPGAHISFAPRFPGSILPFKLAAGESILCRKQTFLCAEKSVTFEIAFQKRLGAGFFGGEGFIIQRVTGPGTVWLDLSGEVVTYDLQPGQKLLVHAGHVGAQSPGVTFDVQMLKGFRNILFGGEGLFLASLVGPGKIWLQSMPIMNLAEAIAQYLPQSGGDSTPQSIGAGVVGGMLKGLLKS